MKIKPYLLGCWLLVLLVQGVQAQTRPPLQLQFIHQQTQEPLPNVTILVNGTAFGTSNEQGKATLTNLAPNATLTFSFVGFETLTWNVDNRNEYVVSMVPLANQMDEIIVIGYGSQKKSNVTTAISSIKAEQLDNMPVVRIENSLQGRVAGIDRKSVV